MIEIVGVVYSSSLEGTDDYRIYEYDQFGQLIKENNEALDKTIVYQYNEVGNIVNVKEYAFCMCSVPKGEYTETTYSYSSSRPDIMTSFNGHNIHYDDLGCPEKYNGKLYTWEKGKLIGIKTDTEDQTVAQSEESSFTYNAYGQRISKKYKQEINVGNDDRAYTCNIEYNYDYSGRLIREYQVQTPKVGDKTAREFIYLYDESGMIGVMFSVNGITPQTYYYHRNLQGDVIAIYDSEGNKQAEYAYDAFGNCEVLYSGIYDIGHKNPIRYRGYYYDQESGLYYLNARYYNPEWRRFISPDDTSYFDPDSVNGLNLYCYCHNDPVNYADPRGHSATLLIVGLISAAVIGGLISGGISACTTYLCGGDVSAAFWGGFVTGALSSLAVGVGMAWGGGLGLLACAGLGFVAGMGGNFVNQSISSYHESGSISINVGDMIFAGVVNSLVCVATMGSMNLYMSDSFNPALLGKTFGSRFVEFVSFDAANTIASVIFGIMYGSVDGAASLTKYVLETTLFKPTTDRRLLISY